jgi:hypothetical protein
MNFAGGRLAFFKGVRAGLAVTKTHILIIRVERANQKNSQLAPARRVAMKMGRRGETYLSVGVSARWKSDCLSTAIMTRRFRQI